MVSLRSPSAIPVVGVLVDGRTYVHLLYLLIAIPLGAVYSSLFSFGFAFGIAFSVVLVGLVILLATLVAARLAAGVERWLANRLLGTDLTRYDDLADDPPGALAGVRKYVEAASTWRAVGFISLKFFVTVFAIIPLFALANGLSLLSAPIRYPYVATFGESNGEPITWAIGTLPESLLAVSVGFVGVLVALHVTNLVAYASRQMAIALLGEPAAAEGGATGDDPETTEEGATGDEPTASSPSSGFAPADADESESEFVPADAVEPESDGDSDRDEIGS
ncbi:sensor domain-containing protein [Halorubrum sp. PV6]|uniref:sensor domain-containing protein n=1 Tax=Halorubrum sp. PV6 TaxID=634157 RepID=UPI000F85528C|nr:sensor domain-containing protein [Halorubrum sp. PV6]AZQ13978.1 histidine kinase [Halorubrum sp. PV6]